MIIHLFFISMRKVSKFRMGKNIGSVSLAPVHSTSQPLDQDKLKSSECLCYSPSAYMWYLE